MQHLVANNTGYWVGDPLQLQNNWGCLQTYATQHEFNELKKQVDGLRKLVDERMAKEDNAEKLRRIAEILKVDLKELL